MKNLLLASLMFAGAIAASSQPCSPLISPANQAIGVKMVHDEDSSIFYNGVLLSFFATPYDPEIPGPTLLISYKKVTDLVYKQYGYPDITSNVYNDSTFLFPLEYNAKYRWYVTNTGIIPYCSTYTDTFEFTTSPPPPYCKPPYYDMLGHVNDNHFVFEHIILKGDLASTCYIRGTYLYEYPTPKNIVKFTAGFSYAATMFQNRQTYMNIWIDYNDDGYFQPIEKVMSYLQVPEVPFEPEYSSCNLYIPLTAVAGLHRARFLTISDPNYGEDPCKPIHPYNDFTRDFYVDISAPTDSVASLAETAKKNECVTQTIAVINPLSNNSNEWVNLTDSIGGLLASINANGNDLSKIQVSSYQNDGPIRTLPNGVKMLDRSIQITPGKQPVTPVDVRLYFSQKELDALMAADPTVTGIESLNISKFSSGCGEAQTGYQYLGQSTSGMIDSFYYVQFSTLSFSNFFLRGGNDATLPVGFISLNAKRAGQHVQVNWQTASESKTAGFEVQYSSDGSNFQKVGYAASKASGGNSSTLLSYSFVDVNAKASGSYYRIRQIGMDGGSTFSGVAFVKGISGNKFDFVKLYPNPAKELVTVELAAAATERVTIEITNMAGKLVKQLKTDVTTGITKLSVPLDGVAAGSYLLVIKDALGNKCSYEKIVKY